MGKDIYTILVVDDTASIRNLIKNELVEGGYNVLEASDGVQALTQALTHLPDLITLDVEMPKMDGFLTYKTLNSEKYVTHFATKKTHKIPIVFVTGNDTLDDRQKGFDLGATDFITKPFAQGEILNIVNKVLKPDQKLQGLSALIVDDSEVARKVCTNILEREGIETIECCDGLEAFKYLKKNLVDLVITDYEMPNMNGAELCMKLRKELNLQNLPVIFLTAVADRSNLLELFKLGATDYLVKPFVKEELVARLSVHFERARLTQSLKETVKSLHKANEEITQLTITDFLTNSFNRKYLSDQLAKEILKSKRYGNPVSILLCDIDYFKQVNDTYGHQAGDAVLVSFVDIINNNIRKDIDWVARYGGEEFVVVLPETGIEGSVVIAERLREAIALNSIVFNGQEIKITASFGCSGYSAGKIPADFSVDHIVTIADNNLYESKKEGRNRVTARELC